MPDVVTHWLFDPAGLTAHGFCLLWEPWLIWTHAGADALIGLAYFSIPAALAIYARRRGPAVFRPVLWLFAAFILLCGTGHWLDLLTLWVPVYHLEGLVKGATGLVSVITAIAVWVLLPKVLNLPTAEELRDARDALRDSKAQFALAQKMAERLQSVIEASPTALVLADADGKINKVNAKAEDLFGYARQEMLGHALETLLPDDLRENHVQLRRGFMGNPVPRAMGAGRDLLGLRKDGSSFPIEIGLNPIRIEDSTMVLAGITDISARREAEQTMRIRQDALERTNAELVRAKQRAEQATRAKSRFLAGMSHELRTPLNGILGYAHILAMEGGMTEVQAARVQAMRSAGQHLLDTINSVLDLSEIEAGKIEIRTSVTGLRQLAADCIEVVRPKIDAKAITLGLEVPDDVPDRLVLDPTRVRQVILNLLGNAVKFTPSGRIDVRMRQAYRAGGEVRLVVEVADTGCGIPAGKRAALFKDFERLGTGAARDIEGAGLGLAISAGLVNLMGGSMAYAENSGGGSIFTFDLPLRSEASGEVEKPAADAMPAPVQPAGKPPAKTASLRILVVDDIAMNRDVATAFLRADGHHVTCADGGDAAVAAASAADFDVVLMDLRMPDVDGFEATRRIQALGGERGRVKIVALTAHAFAEQIEECRRAGMVGHLAKPFNQAALLAVVEAAAGIKPDKRPAGVDAGAMTAVPALPIIEIETYESTVAFLTPENVMDHLDSLCTRIDAVLREMRSRNDAAFADDIVDAVHGLAGSVAMIGFVRLAAAARSFESAARARASETQALADILVVALEGSLHELDLRRSSASSALLVSARFAGNGHDRPGGAWGSAFTDASNAQGLDERKGVLF